MSESTTNEQILRRLNILILLELDKMTPGGGTTVASKIQWLLALGLPAAEVASIVGKQLNYVTATSSSAKKAAKKKGK